MADEKLTPQEEVVKMYLEEQIQKDEFLRTCYVPEKIKKCFEYIKSQARKKAVSGCAMVEDSVVFNWARDYYTDVLPKEKAEVKKEEPIKTTTIAQKTEGKEDKTVTVKKEVTLIKNGVAYDKDGFGLLFPDL